MSNCYICGDLIINRGGRYCGRCAGLNGVFHDWSKVKDIREKEQDKIKYQTKLFV